MKKVLFIDRDGTLILEPPDQQVDSLEKLEFYPGVITALGKIVRELDYELVMVSNQDGLGTISFPEDNFWTVQNKMMSTFRNEGIVFSDILIDHSLPKDNAPTRKPRTGMLTKYMVGNFDLANSYVIGDRETDIQLAENLGSKAIYLGDNKDVKADWITSDWEEIYRYLAYPQRCVTIKRKTSETDINLKLCLESDGKSNVDTGIGFLDHMLTLLVEHSGCRMELKAKGDLKVDEHHTAEDVALVCGEAFNKALGDKAGINRYGFLLPMDESLAQVAIDFSGRSELVWDAKFQREYIGKMPTELFYHFFKSFADTAKCNLNINVSGENEHHKIEAIFKAVGRAIRMAIRRDERNAGIPSTKGVL
ncbi:bifunctional histidinol-phosphatase/imidazoleglycerol-phosphate dehydratase HisB [bacterium]|nr:bifunctional histidinol-phosphatase/imidazoleglycerol-phosphate dehydratase HisB [bacterium]MBU1064538.1 bifunctional histidinol-phosphatase/imidazoleglycerol-phosphate dehydratase HisB [bacterium]MBU1633424.1 bifunctional histidinol-phosphatase/imidazoleglycerol-phosphate dehydratase HisB [bacterium]MBU1873354.1 bifunctional histidinol-phosphatase/imidazoleglycerol-phosphate dehydratase HisB [bacterium]